MQSGLPPVLAADRLDVVPGSGRQHPQVEVAVEKSEIADDPAVEAIASWLGISPPSPLALATLREAGALISAFEMMQAAGSFDDVPHRFALALDEIADRHSRDER